MRRIAVALSAAHSLTGKRENKLTQGHRQKSPKRGDGHVDLVVANTNSDNVGVFLNQGDGSFASQVMYDTGNMPLSSGSYVPSGPGSVAARDFNGDGHVDIATANIYILTIGVFLNLGNGTSCR